MSLNYKHIIEGWSKAMGLMEVTEENQEVSTERLKICAQCPRATQSKTLKFIKGHANNMDTFYCQICKCPVTEKSLVLTEKCPLKKWKEVINN